MGEYKSGVVSANKLHIRLDGSYEWLSSTSQMLLALVDEGIVTGTVVGGHTTVPCSLCCGQHRMAGEMILEVQIPVQSDVFRPKIPVHTEKPKDAGIGA